MICPNCGNVEMVWHSDCSFEEMSCEGEGIVSFYECLECGTMAEIRVPILKNKGEETNERTVRNAQRQASDNARRKRRFYII